MRDHSSKASRIEQLEDPAFIAYVKTRYLDDDVKERGFWPPSAEQAEGGKQ
jgi:hypothetical protein